MSTNLSPQLTYLTPFGEDVPLRPAPRTDRVPDPSADPLLRYEPVRDEITGRELLLVSVDPSSHKRPRERARAYTALDNEIMAGVRIARGSGGGPRSELSRLVGYRDDPTEPFALLEPYRGTPLPTVLHRRRLFEEEQARFRDGLFRALSLLHSWDLVHRNIRPENVRWDETDMSVQLCGLTRATVAGVPREAVGSAPWAPHEQRAGTGRCDTRDDVWSAGLVLFQAVTGHDIASSSHLPLDRYPELAALLEGVFERSAERRPGAGTLLTRATGGALPLHTGAGEHLGQGRSRFPEEARRPAGAGPEVSSADTSEGAAHGRETLPTPPGDGGRAKPWGKPLLILLGLAGAAAALFFLLG
ncbi:protein kinase domain-containing protein [Nocardiopsis algeriensis]|uniref:protein kinase domain-containing protein n=1 Tax=Nocardiopsis algeriensis TaxID=1478215 RepID=UPI003B4290E8